MPLFDKREQERLAKVAANSSASESRQAAERIQADLDALRQAIDRREEIGHLAITFRQAAESLVQAADSLVKAAENLDRMPPL